MEGFCQVWHEMAPIPGATGLCNDRLSSLASLHWRVEVRLFKFNETKSQETPFSPH